MNPFCFNPKDLNVRQSLRIIYDIPEIADDAEFEKYCTKYSTNIQQVTDKLQRLGLITAEEADDINTLNINLEDLSEKVRILIKENLAKHYFTFKDGITVETPFELNSQQMDALNEINDFVTSGESTMTLAGYAGTGKTSLMEIIAKKLGRNRHIVFTATTHAAAAVLKSRVEKLGYDAYTVHKAFGINVELDEKQEEYDAKQLVNVIRTSKILYPNSVVIIDEASMINEAQYEVLSTLTKELKLKVIYVGDKAQLAPVKENQISKVFRSETNRQVELTQVERTGDNAILKEATALRDGQELSNKSEFNTEGKGVAYVKPSNKQSIKDIVQKFAPKLRNNPNYFRVLAFTNATVASYNQAVRKALGYEDFIPRVGEPMLGYKNYGYHYGEYDLINSGSYVVTSVGEPTIRTYKLGNEDLEFKTVLIGLSDSLGGTHFFYYVDIKGNSQNRINATRLAQLKINLWQEYKRATNSKQKKETLNQINYIDEFLAVNDTITKGGKTLVEKVIDFGYAMTVHKSQGSTFKNVILDEDDINNARSKKFENTDITVADVKKQLEYVGVTRATDTVTIISSDTEIEDTPLNHKKVIQPKETVNSVLEQFKKNIEHLSGYFEGGGVTLSSILPNMPIELLDKLADHFMGGVELTLDDYRELWKHIRFDNNGNPVQPQTVKDVKKPEQNNIISEEFYTKQAAQDYMNYLVAEGIKREDIKVEHTPETEDTDEYWTVSYSQNTESQEEEIKTEIVVEYTPKGKERQTYTIKGSHIYNKEGEEVFKENSVDRNKIFANLAVKQGRAVVVEHKGGQYVVNNKRQIISVTTGKIMQWGEENGDRKAILDSAQPKLASLTKGRTQQETEVIETQEQLEQDLGGGEEAKSEIQDVIKVAKRGMSFEEALAGQESFFTEEEQALIKQGLNGKHIEVMSVSRKTDPAFFAKEIVSFLERNSKKPLNDPTRVTAIEIWTKHDGLPIKDILDACKKYRVAPMVSFSITGLGGTALEGGVMKYQDMLQKVGELIKNGSLNATTTTVRIDPILPGVTNMEDIKKIVETAKSFGIKKFVTSLVQSYGYLVNTPKDRKVVSGIDKALATEGKTYDWEKYYGTITQEDIRKSSEFIKEYYKQHPKATWSEITSAGAKKGIRIVTTTGLGKIHFIPKFEIIDEIGKVLLELDKDPEITIQTCSFSIKGLKESACLDPLIIERVVGVDVLRPDGTYNRDTSRPDCMCYGGRGDFFAHQSKKCYSSCSYCYAAHSGDNKLNYYNEDGTLKDNRFTRTSENQISTEAQVLRTHQESNLKLSDYGVVIEPNYKTKWKTWLENNPHGIVALRVGSSTKESLSPEFARANRTMGNPFMTWLNTGVHGKDTISFRNWLTTGNNEGNQYATEELRQVYLELIEDAAQNGGKILYFKDLKPEESHASVIGELIQNKIQASSLNEAQVLNANTINTDEVVFGEDFTNEVERLNQQKEEAAEEANKTIIDNYKVPVLEVNQQQLDDVNSKLTPERQEVVSKFTAKVFIKYIEKRLQDAQERISKIANDTKKPGETLEEATRRVKIDIKKANSEYIRRLRIAREPQTRDEELEKRLVNQIIPLEQIDVINRDGLQSIVDSIRDIINNSIRITPTEDMKNLLNIAVDNFPLIFKMASTRINQAYGLDIFGELDNIDLNEDDESDTTRTAENNVQNEEGSVKEDFSRNGDHSKSTELSLSKEVRLLYQDIYQTYKNGKIIKDALNQPVPVDLSLAHATISNQLRFMIDARDMIPLLMRMSQPWVKQLLDKLVVCDEKGNPILNNGLPTIKDDNLFNAFYTSYRLYFQPMTVMYKDKKNGQYRIKNLGVTENVQYLMNIVRRNIATSTPQGTEKHSLYENGKINKTQDTIEDVKSLDKFVREVRLSYKRKEYSDIDSLFKAHDLETKLKNYLQNIGFEISSDLNLLDEIKSSTKSNRESFDNYFNTLNNLLSSILAIYNFTINKVKDENVDIVNNSRRDYVLIAQILSGSVSNVVETSTNEDGKNIYSLGKPNYLSNMIQKIKQTVSDKTEGNREYYNAWVENTFGQFDFFKDQDSGKWRSDICEKLFRTSPHYREIFDHTRLLKIGKSDYTKWTERECNLALFNMYNSIDYNKETGNEQQAWFRLFLFSDSPAGDFIKFIKYVDTENQSYQDILVDKFWGLFNQERSRIRNVKERLNKQVHNESLNLIAGYDATLDDNGNIKTAGGLVFRFMPGLNYLKIDKSFITSKLETRADDILGLSFREAIDKLDTNANEWELTDDDIKEIFKIGFLKVFDTEFEKSYKALFDSGTIEVDDNGFVEGMINSKGENIKLHSASTETLKELLPSLLENPALPSDVKDFLTSIQNKIESNKYVSEDDLFEAVKTFNIYADVSQEIQFEHSPLWEAWREYEMNYNFMTSQTLQLCTSDLAFYGKVECKKSTKDDYDFNVEINGKNQYYKIISDSTIKTLQKRFKELHAPSSKGNQFLGKYKQEYEKTVYLSDKEIQSLVYNEIEKIINNNENLTDTEKAGILKAFREVNVADAQAYRSIESYETVLGQMGMMTNDMAFALEHIKKGEFSRWDLQTVFQTLKPYVYTRVSKDSHVTTEKGNPCKISVPVQHKNSEFALMVIYSAIGQSLSKSPVLVGLHKFMKENNIDVVQFESTTKVGLQSKLKNKTFEESDNVAETLKLMCGITDDNPDGNPEIVHKIPMEDWGIQTATPEHIIDKRQLIGTQIRKLIMSDMPDDAEFTFGKITKTKKEWIKIYNDIIHEQILDAAEQLDERFNPDKSSAVLEIQKVIHEFIATSHKYDNDLIEACTWNGTGFNIPLSDRCMTEKIQEILNSIVKSRVTKQKIRGGACIQVSDYGFETTDKLKIKYKDDGSIDYIPCMMPLYSKDLYEKFADEKGNIKIEDIEKEAPELLKAIGYRVPTEDMYSMAHLKIVGFTPIYNGSVIMLPSEITTISGSDFDVDKLYLMLHDFHVIKYDMAAARAAYNKEKGITPNTKKDEEAVAKLLDSIFGVDISEDLKAEKDIEFKKWFNANCDKYLLPAKKWRIKVPKYDFEKDAKEQSSSARNNGMIDMMYSVLQQPYAAKKILNPGNFDPQKRASRICNIIDNNTPQALMAIMGTKSLNSAIRKIRELTIKQLDALEDSLSKTDNPLSSYTAVKLHQQNMTGASQVGIYANYNVLHTLLQQCDVRIAGDFIINGNEALNKENPTKLGNILNGRNKYISKISAGYLAASVDNGKDPLLKGLNSTPETANIIGFLSLCGYEPLEVGAFMTIPAVRQVFDLISLQKISFIKALYQVRASLTNSLEKLNVVNETIEDVRKDIKNLSIDTMLLCKVYANETNLSQNNKLFFLLTEWEALANLESINQHSQELSRILTISRADTQNGGAGPLNIKNVDKEIRKEQLDKKRLKNRNSVGELNPYYKIYAFNTPNEETFVGDFYKYGIEKVGQLFGKYFTEYSPVGTAIIGLISNEYGVPEQLARRAFDDWQKYNLMSTELFGQQGDIDINTKMEYYVKQFPKEFVKWKESISENIAQLTFVTNMELEEKNDNEPYDHLRLSDLGKTSSVRERIKLDWLKLYEYDADMATKLFVYGGLRGGFGFNPKSYLHLAPTQLRVKMPKYVETLNAPVRFSKFYEFWKQFCRNNWKEKSIVPRLNDNNTFTVGRNGDGSLIIETQGIKDGWEEVKLLPSVVLDDSGKTPVLYEIATTRRRDTEAFTTSATYKPTTALGLGDLYREYNPNSVFITSIFKKEETESSELTTDDIPETEPEEINKPITVKKETDYDVLGTTDDKTTRAGETHC